MACAMQGVRRVGDKLRRAVMEEMHYLSEDVKQTNYVSLAFLLAVICVGLVIVGNVILLIAINFWIATFPSVATAHNSSQIAIQVVASLFLFIIFGTLLALLMMVHGVSTAWHTLCDTNRMRGPLYRLLLLFLSGASNAVSSLLATYSMTYVPQFVQAVLMCSIPFASQAWTVLLIPVERQRNYLSILFVTSSVLIVAGVLLSSLFSFLEPEENGRRTPWSWTLIYLLSALIFGLWCVVQRLYLDAIVVKPDEASTTMDVTKKCLPHPSSSPLAVAPSSVMEGNAPHGPAQQEGMSAERLQQVHPLVNSPREGSVDGEEHTTVTVTGDVPPTKAHVASLHVNSEGALTANAEEEEEEEIGAAQVLPATYHVWGETGLEDFAIKLVLLVMTVVFQALVSFVLFPIDAIPWFGTSASASEAWRGFRESFDFIFQSWFNVRYGLLYSLGFAMSYVGCTYLNEHSPTLSSVVMQIAGPVTSLAIIIVPQWNVYQETAHVGYKVGGVVLLFIAALLYHFWDQRSIRQLLQRAQTQEEVAASGGEPILVAAEHVEQSVITSKECNEKKEEV